MDLRLPKSKGILRREAANWLARLQGGRDPEMERKFRRWYDADPRHASAFDRVRVSYEQAAILRHSPLASKGVPQPTTRMPQWSAVHALAAAASIAVLAPVAIALLRGGNQLFGGTEAVMLMTSVGEIRQVDLADGSKVTLDTSTRLEVQIGRSHRGARLRYGRARFQIAVGSEPFIVHTGATTVAAPQGVIDVQQAPQQDRVDVLAGAAEVRGARQATAIALGAGEGVTVSSGKAEPKGGPSTSPDWTRGMLQFDRTPLADAVAAANRYSERHIVLLGDVGTLQVSGAFRAGDTAGLAKALGAAFNLSVRRQPDGTVVLSRGRGIPKKRGG